MDLHLCGHGKRVPRLCNSQEVSTLTPFQNAT